MKSEGEGGQELGWGQKPVQRALWADQVAQTGNGDRELGNTDKVRRVLVDGKVNDQVIFMQKVRLVGLNTVRGEL